MFLIQENVIILIEYNAIRNGVRIMNQIKCPKCGEVFTIDESSYNEILSQIKKETIQSEVHEKLELLKVQNEKDIIIEKGKVLCKLGEE